jgi:Tfp pilus assembly protein FimV
MTNPIRFLGAAVIIAGLAAADTTRASESSVDAALSALFSDGSFDSHIRDRRESEVLEGSYEVRQGDTLDQIIELAFPGSLIRNSVLRQAFVERNPRAFRGNNPNWLLAGVTIDVPVAQDIQDLLFEDPARIRELYPRDTSGWVKYP